MVTSVQTAEELRDILLDLQRENADLRLASSQGKLLVAALESLLSVDSDMEPFAVVFQSLQQVFDYAYSSVMVEEGDYLHCIAAEKHVCVGQEMPISSQLKKVLNGRVSVKLGTSLGREQTDNDKEMITAGQPALYLPIRVQEKRGVLVLVRSSEADGFDRADISLAQRFSLLASHALAIRSHHQSADENNRLQELTEKLEYHAYFDQLTGLPNRSLMQQRVNKALGARLPKNIFALAFIDVDKFKQINDYFGHSLGDRLLEKIANRISAVIRETDTLARISGDEFVLLIDPLKNRKNLAQVVARVTEILNATYVIEGHEIHASVSIGISICPDHGNDYEALRSNADNAMYRAKGSNKGDPVYFNAEMGRALTARMELENRLRRAIRDKSFVCALQPKIDLDSASISGFEALVRWRDEEGAIHPPGAFLTVATELGLLNEITEIVCSKAIEALSVLEPVFGDDISIALNVGGAQANDHEFMQHLVATLMASGCASRFILELTEDAMVAATQFRSLVQPILKAADIRVSIDDFGTGYSCLSALAEIQADELKIDRSFITGVHNNPINQRILFAIENLAQAIGMNVVAEGVETREDLEFLLQNTSIDQVQGFLFARPMAAKYLAEIGDGMCPPELRDLILRMRAEKNVIRLEANGKR